jgi:hypothetical protein
MRPARARSDAHETMGMDAGARGGKRKAADSSALSRHTMGTSSRLSEVKAWRGEELRAYTPMRAKWIHLLDGIAPHVARSFG